MTPGPDRTVEIATARNIASSRFTDPEFRIVDPQWSILQEAIASMEQRVFGQTRAVTSVAKSAIRVKAGGITQGKPEYAGLWTGLPGVGKSELGVAVAEFYWGADWKKHYLKIPCATFSSEYTVGRLTGSVPGYRDSGDQNALLVDPEFTKERNVIVFEEIENGHPQLQRVLLGIVEDGELTVQVRQGNSPDPNVPLEKKVIDFSQSTVIFTSNIGSSEVLRELGGNNKVLGFNKQTRSVDVNGIIGKALEDYFNSTCPAFLDRIPEPNRIVFDPLTPDVWRMVFDKTLAGFNMDVIATNLLKDWIIDKLDPNKGARQLRHLIDDKIITPASLIRLGQGAFPLIAGLDNEDGEEVVFKAHQMFLSPSAPTLPVIMDEHLGGLPPRQATPNENGFITPEITDSGLYLARI